MEAWRDSTLGRLCDLGVATLAAWTNSALDLWQNLRAYPVSVGFYDTAPEVPGWLVGLTGRHLRDFFDPSWPDAALAYARGSQPLARCAADPWCYGAFVDNELPWGATTLSTGTHLDAYLTLPPALRQARAAGLLRGALRGRRRGFNAEYETELASFDGIQQLDRLTDCARRSCSARTTAQARVRGATRNAWPSRPSSPNATRARSGTPCTRRRRRAQPRRALLLDLSHPTSRAIVPHVDVVSLNDYD